MTWRGTGLLVLAVLTLGLYAWWSSPPDPAVRRAAAPDALLARDVDVSRVRLRADSRTVRLRRDAQGWRAEGEEGERVDVESLLAALRTVEPLMVVGSAPEDLERFGLASPSARLELWSDAERLLRLDLGDRNPSWTGVYARRDERAAIELVGAVLYWEIEKLLARIAPRGEA